MNISALDGIFLNFKVRVASSSDIPKIILLLQGFEYPFGEAHYRWKYQHCPWDSVAVVAESKGDIIGHFGHIFRPFWILNQQVQVGLTVDLIVQEEYRGKGVFSEMSHISLQMAAEKKVDFLYGFPNELSLPRNVKLNAKNMGYLPFYVKIINSKKYRICKRCGKET